MSTKGVFIFNFIIVLMALEPFTKCCGKTVKIFTKNLVAPLFPVYFAIQCGPGTN